MNKVFCLANPSGVSWNWKDELKFVPDSNYSFVDRTVDDDLENILLKAVTDGFDRFLIVGGEGTVNRSLNFFWRETLFEKVTVSTLPGGTCNDFCRYVKPSMNSIQEIMENISTKESCPLDLVEISSEDGISQIFLNNAGFGRSKESFDRGDAGLAALMAFEPINVSINVDENQETSVECYMGLVCNAPYFSCGYFFSKDISIDDGNIELFVPRAGSKFMFVLKFLLNKFSVPLVHWKNDVSMFKGETIRVECKDTMLWPQADGEPPTSGVHTVTYKVLPGVLNYIRV